MRMNVTKVFECEVCWKRFASKKSRRLHRKTHTTKFLLQQQPIKAQVMIRQIHRRNQPQKNTKKLIVRHNRMQQHPIQNHLFNVPSAKRCTVKIETWLTILLQSTRRLTVQNVQKVSILASPSQLIRNCTRKNINAPKLSCTLH